MRSAWQTLKSGSPIWVLGARDGKLAMEDLTGGTFTITNGGTFGSMMSTPILNPPQVGILGMHKYRPARRCVAGRFDRCPADDVYRPFL